MVKYLDSNRGLQLAASSAGSSADINCRVSWNGPFNIQLWKSAAEKGLVETECTSVSLSAYSSPIGQIYW